MTDPLANELEVYRPINLAQQMVVGNQRSDGYKLHLFLRNLGLFQHQL